MVCCSECIFLYKNRLENHNQAQYRDSNHSVTELTSEKPLTVQPYTSDSSKPWVLIQGNQHEILLECMFTCAHINTHTPLWVLSKKHPQEEISQVKVVQQVLYSGQELAGKFNKKQSRSCSVFAHSQASWNLRHTYKQNFCSLPWRLVTIMNGRDKSSYLYKTVMDCAKWHESFMFPKPAIVFHRHLSNTSDSCYGCVSKVQLNKWMPLHTASRGHYTKGPHLTRLNSRLGESPGWAKRKSAPPSTSYHSAYLFTTTCGAVVFGF